MPNTPISRLRQERERRGWSRNYLAEQIKVDVVTVGRWERGERLPHPVYRQQLCDLFKMNAEDLGLFSEPLQEPDKKVIDAESSSEKAFFMDGGEPQARVDSSDAMEPMNEGTGSSQSTPFPQKETTRSSYPWIRQRRMVLIGLGGLGLASLMGTGFLFFSHASSPLAAPPRILKGPSQHLIDPASNNWVNRLAWSPNGHEIAAANGTNHISIWDIKVEALLHTYPTLNSWVNDISWSKANRIAVANADPVKGSIQIWNYPDKTPLVIFQRAYPLRTVAWSPNGTYLAFAGHATTVEVWNPFTSLMVSRYTYPALGLLGISRVRWSATGSFLVCATDDGTVHVWEALTGKPRTIYRGHKSRVIDVAWSPDERYIASSGVDKTTRVWEALTGQTVFVYQGQVGEVDGVGWSLQGKHIVSGSADHTAHVWEAFTGRLVAKYEGLSGTVETVLWSKDGKTIALGTNTQGIEIWQVPQ